MEFLTTLDQLEALYGDASPGSLQKETPFITDDYRRLIEASPFVTIATAGADGMDCSPKGDAPGFVRVLDEHTLAIPDRRGNNRLDSLRNLMEDPRIGLLFLIPGVGETLRVNGTAHITADEGLRTAMAVRGKTPNVVIVVDVESVYFHCSKAILRSELWDRDHHVERSTLPTPGQIKASLGNAEVDAATADTMYERQQLENLY
ncbi:MAG: pyridoxamine 5'-phosphate oxidase family protein [Acidimicrobiia bacterium]